MNDLQRIRNEFGRRFFHSVLAILIINTMLCMISEYFQKNLYVVPLTFFVVLTLLVAYTGFLLRKITYNFNTVFRTVLCVFFLAFTYLSILLCNISETIFLYYLPTVSLFLMLNSFRATFTFVFFLVILCFFIPDISKVSGIALSKEVYHANRSALKFQEYVVIAISVFYSLFILYYTMKFNEIKNLHHSKKEEPADGNPDDVRSAVPISHTGTEAVSNDGSSDDRLKILYLQIIRLFDEEKLFQCPDFNIKRLAEKVNSNTTYVSAALNKIGNKKFNQLVNEYRIMQVKIFMAENVHYKVNIEHIYTSAGFSSQSTFNRIFKEYVGLTPTEYLDNLQKARG